MKKQFFLLVMSVCGVLFVATTQNARAGFLPKEQKSWVIDDDSGTSTTVQTSKMGLVNDTGFTSTQISATNVEKNVAKEQMPVEFKESPNVANLESGRVEQNTPMLNSGVAVKKSCEQHGADSALGGLDHRDEVTNSFSNSFDFADMNKKLGTKAG